MTAAFRFRTSTFILTLTLSFISTLTLYIVTAEFAEDAMVERRKACTKYFWLFFYETPNLVRGYAASFTGQDFSRSNNLQAMNSVPQVFLGPRLRGKLFGGEKFCFCNPSARSAEKNWATLDWVTQFLWYRARAARRKFCFCNPSARSAEKTCASDEFAEDTMVERRKACTQYFWLFFYETPNPVRGYGASFFVEKNFASYEQFAGSIFWSGATEQDFSRSKILQAMNSVP